MSYASTTDLMVHLDKEVLAELTGGTGESPDGTILAAVLSAIDARIDAALNRAGYDVPVTSPPTYLSGLSARLALRPLFDRRAHRMDVPKSIADTYEEAERELEDIARGRKGIPGLTKNASSFNVEAEDARGWHGAF